MGPVSKTENNKKTYLIGVMLGICMIILVLVAYGQISVLQKSASDLEANKSSLSDQVTALAAENAALLSQKANLQQQVTSLQTNASSLATQVANLQTQVTALQGNATQLEDQKAKLNSQIALLQSEIAFYEHVMDPESKLARPQAPRIL